MDRHAADIVRKLVCCLFRTAGRDLECPNRSLSTACVNSNWRASFLVAMWPFAPARSTHLVGRFLSFAFHEATARTPTKFQVQQAPAPLQSHPSQQVVIVFELKFHRVLCDCASPPLLKFASCVALRRDHQKNSEYSRQERKQGTITINIVQRGTDTRCPDILPTVFPLSPRASTL